MTNEREALKLALEAQLAQPAVASEQCNNSEHLEPVAYNSELKAQAKRAYPHDEKRELAFIDGWLSREATQHQNTATTDWGAVHDKLMDVWHRELSADEGLDEIQGLINTTPPQRTWVHATRWRGLTDEQMQFLATAIGQAQQIIDTHNAEFVTARDDLRRCAELLAAHGIKGDAPL